MFIRKTQILNKTNYDKVIYNNMDTFELLSKDFNVDWNERKKKIMRNFKNSMVSI